MTKLFWEFVAMKELNCPNGYRQQQDIIFYTPCMLCFKSRKWTTSQDNVHQNPTAITTSYCCWLQTTFVAINNTTERYELLEIFIFYCKSYCILPGIFGVEIYWTSKRFLRQSTDVLFPRSFLDMVSVINLVHTHARTHSRTHTRTESFTNFLVFLKFRGHPCCWTIPKDFQDYERTWTNKCKFSFLC
jgi:hypothetical protein